MRTQHGGRRPGAGRKPADPSGEKRVSWSLSTTKFEKRLIKEYLEYLRSQSSEGSGE